MFEEAFLDEYRFDLKEVLKVIPNEVHYGFNGCSQDTITYHVHHTQINIPYRMYFKEIDPKNLDAFSDVQKEILYCIYTRHNNGYIREKYVKALFDLDFHKWSIPFIVKLADEYVVEILEVIYDACKDRDNDDIKQFCKENASAIQKGYTRMISYWNEYYRDREFHFHNYIGRKLFRECFGYDRSFEKIKGV